MRTSKSEPIRIFLIGSQRLTRAALRALIETRSGFAVAGEADSCEEAADSIAGDSLILLIDLPEYDVTPIRDFCRLLAVAPKSRAIVLAGFVEPSMRTEIVKLGAVGLLTKDQSPDLLFKAIEGAHDQWAWIDSSTLNDELHTSGQPTETTSSEPPADDRLAALTKRERDIVNATVMGLKNRQVADRLFISETTVRHHLTSIFTKLGVRGRFELLQFAYQNGLAKPVAKRPAQAF